MTVEEKGLINWLYVKIAEESNIQWLRLPVGDNDLLPVEVRFQHKNLPMGITADWVQNVLNQILKYFETGKEEDWFLKDTRPLIFKHKLERLSHTDPTLFNDRKERYVPVIEKIVSNVSETVALFKEVEAKWTGDYPENWNDPIGSKTMGQLMAWLGKKQRKNYMRNNWNGVTSGHLASFLDLTKRQLDNIKPKIFTEADKHFIDIPIRTKSGRSKE